MLKIAYSYGRHFYEDGNMQAAGYFINIFTKQKDRESQYISEHTEDHKR